MNQNSATNGSQLSGPAHTSKGLINGIVQSLRELEDGDSDLTEILAEYVITISPLPDAVEKAAEEIVQLAVERAQDSDD